MVNQHIERLFLKLDDSTFGCVGGAEGKQWLERECSLWVNIPHYPQLQKAILFHFHCFLFIFNHLQHTPSHRKTAQHQTENQTKTHNIYSKKTQGKVAQQPHFYLWPNNAEYSGHCQLIYACIIIKICKIGQSIKKTKLEHKAEKTLASEIFCTKLDQISQNRPTKKSNQF